MSSIVALDVGGTSIKSGVIELDRTARADDGATGLVTIAPTVPTCSTEAADVVLAQLASAVVSAEAIASSDIVGLAIAFPGPFDVAGGRALIRGLHKFESIYALDLRSALRERLAPHTRAVPIEFARDSESAGIGEAVFGAGRAGHRVLTVPIGTGLGACLTDDGRLVETVGDLEIEKLAQRPTSQGRADDVLSARGLAGRLGIETATLGSLVDRPEVIAAIADHGRLLGAFLAPVVKELDVDLIIVGGGLVAAWELFAEQLRGELAPTRCERATLGSRGPLLGAALLAFPNLFPPPG
jgi:glucokinase